MIIFRLFPAALLLSVPLPVQAQDASQATDPANDARATPGADEREIVVEEEKPKRVCETRTETGSIMPRRVCRTPEQVQREQEGGLFLKDQLSRDAETAATTFEALTVERGGAKR